jgi:uncharacterized protein YwgA
MIKIDVNSKCFYVMGILKIAKDLGVSVSATKLQKLVFLIEKELNFNLGYEFIPYYFGPFSKELQDDVYRLKNLGYVEVKEEAVEDFVSGAIIGFKKVYKISDKVTFDFSSLDKNFVEFVVTHLKIPLDDLLKYVYVKYPEYTVNSVIKDRIF